MSKKYIAPFDLFDGKVKKGSIYRPCAINRSYYPENISVFGIPKEIVEKWEEYIEFKKGEFVTIFEKSYNSKWILILNEIEGLYYKYLVCYGPPYLYTKESYVTINGREARPSTEEEKQLLISKLKEEGKFYNPVTHSIDDINPHQDMIDEWEKDKSRVVQYYSHGKWIDTSNNIPYWTRNDKYRFKPSQKWVPFTFEDHEMFKNRWVKYKNSDSPSPSLHSIYHVLNTCIRFGPHNTYTYQQAFESLVFEDGSTFGKLIEE